MYKDKSGIYYVSLTTPGGDRLRKSTGTRDKKLASDLEALWKTEMLRSASFGNSVDPTFEDIETWYLKDHGSTTNAGAFKSCRFLFAGKTSAISPDTVEECVHMMIEKGNSIATVRRNLSVISSAYTKAAKTKQFRGVHNPIKGNLPKAEAQERIRWEEKVVINNLAAAALPVVQDFIMAAAYSGMRRGELLNLTWDRVNLPREILYLNPEHQKGRRYSVVPMNAILKDVILRRFRERAEFSPDSYRVFLHEGKPVDPNWLRHRFTEACEKVGLKDFRIHDLRHCFCTWLFLDGADLYAVKEAARHTDIRTTLKYTHMASERLRETVSLLDGVVPGDAPDVVVDMQVPLINRGG